ncbi:MAG: hypothetical protein H6653_07870 [Ardenticatenaceae bacterium]|nr:hypothetical protein [Ardenticatenaceae bacterium]
MTIQFLTVEYAVGNDNQYVITLVNGQGVDQYERELKAASIPKSTSKFGSKSPVVLLPNTPSQWILSSYLNELGKRGWDFCTKLSENMILMKKPG